MGTTVQSQNALQSRAGPTLPPLPDERFEEHLRYPVGLGRRPDSAHDGAAGGAACGDLIRFSVAVLPNGAVDAGFDAEGCGALVAAGSAVCDLAGGAPVLSAAAISPQRIADDLGGLSPGKWHAADLAVDAFHRALGAAAVGGPQLPVNEDLVLVAMSGGVDSAVAAVLSGPDAAGVTVELWRDTEGDPAGSCCSATAVRAARAMAHEAGMPHLTVDLRDAFRAGVVEPWIAAHEAGLTPNPCVRCNGSVRLDAMADLATKLGASSLATGHYARISEDGLLRTAADPNKDQSYMLAGLAPDTIARLRFPLGELTKPEVREIAREHGLAVADAPESQDLCFLAGTARDRFLARHGGLTDRDGAIVDEAGEVVGAHRGYFHYTVGQRRGLGVHRAEPMYVVATDPASNTVTVGPRASLAAQRVSLLDVTLHRRPESVSQVKLRYRADPVACTMDGDSVILKDDFSAPAAGQTAVLLDGEIIIGSATIAS